MSFVKHDEGKVRLSLIPIKPLLDIGRVLTFGAGKYSDDNWRKAARDEGLKRYKDALYRHWAAYLDGERTDPESGFPTLAHAGCSLLFLHWYEHYYAAPETEAGTPEPLPLTIRVHLDKERLRRAGFTQGEGEFDIDRAHTFCDAYSNAIRQAFPCAYISVGLASPTHKACHVHPIEVLGTEDAKVRQRVEAIGTQLLEEHR